MPSVSSIESKRIRVQNQALSIDCYLSKPEMPKGVVIVIHEVFGVNAHLRSVVDRLAWEGYAAIAPNMVQRSAPRLDLDYSDESLALGRSHKDLMTAEQIASDLAVVIAGVKHWGPVSVMGFCFGGHVAFLGGMLPEVAATIVFYGSGIGLLTPGGGEPTVKRVAEISGRVLMFYGLQDDLIANEQADAVEAALEKVGVEHQVIRYEAGHGFFCEARSSFNPEAATDSWNRVLQCLDEVRDHSSSA